MNSTPANHSDNNGTGLQTLLDSAPFACTIWNGELNIVACNSEAIRLFEIGSQDDYILRFFDLSPEAQPDGQMSRAKMLGIVGDTFIRGRSVCRWTHRNLLGELLPAEIIFTRVKIDSETYVTTHTYDLRPISGYPSGSVISADGGTYGFARSLLESMPFGFLIWDENMILLDCSTETLNLLRVREKDVLLSNFYSYSPLHQPDGIPSREKAYRMIQKAFITGREIFEWLHKNAEGGFIPTEITLVKVNINGKYFVTGYIRDLRVLKETLELKNRLEVLAFSDSLTGIHNRHYFIETARRISGQNTLPISIIMFDLDNFKLVNDTYGHQAGDAVLIEVAAAVQASLRPSDLFARYGGEEFILLIPESTPEMAMKLAERIRCIVAESGVVHNDHIITSTISLGVATQTNAFESLGVLIGSADTALYKAKHKGKNTTVHA
ncbi:MAG: sensor domain-containing diguanylate cyclase [Defluviitaleaceae bacterium]|nr:sensor domain-containing diguanylate cyclase [Defluviitaleaceae bacterium]